MPPNAVVILLLGLSLTANADNWRTRDYDRESNADRGDRSERRDTSEQRRSRPQLSADEAARQAQARHGGRVLRISDGASQYIVRLLLDDGRVINVPVNK